MFIRQTAIWLHALTVMFNTTSNKQCFIFCIKRILCWPACQVMFPEVWQAAVPPAVQCHTFGQHNRLLFIFTFYTSHSRQAKRSVQHLKMGRSSVPALFRMCSRRPNQAHDFCSGLLVKISYGRKQRCNTVAGLQSIVEKRREKGSRVVSQLAS